MADTAAVLRDAADELASEGSFAVAASTLSVARGLDPDGLVTPQVEKRLAPDRWLDRSPQQKQFDTKWGAGGASIRAIVTELEAALAECRGSLRSVTQELVDEKGRSASLEMEVSELTATAAADQGWSGQLREHYENLATTRHAQTEEELGQARQAELQIMGEMETALEEASRRATDIRRKHAEQVAGLEAELERLRDQSQSEARLLEAQEARYREQSTRGSELEASLLEAERTVATLRAEAERKEQTMERARNAALAAKKELAAQTEAVRQMQTQNYSLLEAERALRGEHGALQLRVKELERVVRSCVSQPGACFALSRRYYDILGEGSSQ